MWDWKMKWANYDLRLSISAPAYLQDLADDIEYSFYKKGKRAEMEERLSEIPNLEFKLSYLSYCDLSRLYNEHFPEF
jgi:hypothetical protein